MVKRETLSMSKMTLLKEPTMLELTLDMYRRGDWLYESFKPGPSPAKNADVKLSSIPKIEQTPSKPKEDEVYPCSTCGKIFFNKYSVKRHVTTQHNGPKPSLAPSLRRRRSQRCLIAAMSVVNVFKQGICCYSTRGFTLHRMLLFAVNVQPLLTLGRVCWNIWYNIRSSLSRVT